MGAKQLVQITVVQIHLEKIKNKKPPLHCSSLLVCPHTQNHVMSLPTHLNMKKKKKHLGLP